jgi:hypothetical protein
MKQPELKMPGSMPPELEDTPLNRALVAQRGGRVTAFGRYPGRGRILKVDWKPAPSMNLSEALARARAVKI